jgi:hypothetical protein
VRRADVESGGGFDRLFDGCSLVGVGVGVDGERYAVVLGSGSERKRTGRGVSFSEEGKSHGVERRTLRASRSRIDRDGF